MRVAGIPLGVGLQNSGQVVLNLPFVSSINDVSSFNTPMSLISGTPDFTTGAMHLQSTVRVRTGATINDPQTNLDLFGKLYTIEFDVKMQASANPTTVLYRGRGDSSNSGGFTIDATANTLKANNVANVSIFPTHNLGFDSTTVFFNVKLRRTALQSYELLVNDVVVASVSGYTAGVMDNNTNSVFFHGFSFGTPYPNRPFYIKNFKVTTGG